MPWNRKKKDYEIVLFPVCMLVFTLLIGCIADTKKETEKEIIPLEPIQILTPNGKEVYHIGDTVTVTWLVDKSRLGPRGVTLDISLDEGFYWISLNNSGNLITFDDPKIFKGNKGTFRFVIEAEFPDPNGGAISSVSNQCRIKVYDPYADPIEMDYSDENFSIETKK